MNNTNTIIPEKKSEKKSAVVVGITGHRTMIHDKTTLKEILKNKLTSELKADLVITGMAIGWDTLVAETCVELGIPFVAAVPCIGQERLWPPFAQQHYKNLLAKAERIEIVSPGGYAAWKMHVRNEWIVKNSDLMVAYFDGADKGGTSSCLKFARRQGKKIHNIFEALPLPEEFKKD